MKGFKRVLTAVLACAVATPLGAAMPVFADASISDTIGLGVSTQTEKNNASYDKIANYAVVDLADSLGVFSVVPDSNNYYNITADALLNTVSSSNGYELSLVKADKTTAVTGRGANNAREGMYLKASKDGADDVFMPIVESYPLKFDAQAGGNNGYMGQGASLGKQKGFGGMPFDKEVSVFTMDGETALTTPRIQYKTAALYGSNTNPSITNYSFSVYVDGSAIASVYKQGGGELIRIAADGKLSYDDNGTFKESSTTLEPGKWHRIVLNCQDPRNHVALFADGVKISENLITWSAPGNVMTEVRLGVNNSSGAGNVAYADVAVSRGVYTASALSADTIADIASDKVALSNDTGVITFSNISDLDELKAALAASGAKEVKFYNSDLSAYAKTIADAKHALLTSASGYVDKVFDLEEKEIELTPMQKIGLTVSDKYTKGFKHLNSTSQIDNLYVKTLTAEENGESVEKLVVYNNKYQVEYTAFGWKVLETLSSANGYTLSIWDSTKTIERSVDNYHDEETDINYGSRTVDMVVAGDWLKAEKDGEVIWIPIIDKVEVMKSDDLSSLGGHNWQTDITKVSQQGGISGKSASDTAYTITAENAIDKNAKLQLDSADMKKYYTGNIYTYTVNVYAEGDATAKVCINNGADIDALVWAPDGSYSYNVNGANVKADSTLARGKWHKVAMTLDYDRGRLHFFADGKLLTSTSTFLKTFNRIDLGMLAGSVGTVAYDDFRLYEGYYDRSEDTVDFKAEEAAISDDTLRYLEGTSIDTVKGVVAVNVPGTSISEYGNEYLLVTPSKSYHYLATKEYAVNELTAMAADNLTLTVADGKVTAQTIFKVGLPDSTLYLAEYDETGALLNIYAEETDADGEPMISADYNEGSSYRAFLWITNDDYTMLPVSLAK